MQPRLLAISGSLKGTVRPLVEGQISIGRDESNQLRLNSTTERPLISPKRFARVDLPNAPRPRITTRFIFCSVRYRWLNCLQCLAGSTGRCNTI